MKDLIRFGHYDLELYHIRKQPIQRIIIFSANVPQRTLTELDIGSVKQHHRCIFLEHDFNGDEIYGTIKEKIETNEAFTNIDKLHMILLPMMKSRHRTTSQRAAELTDSLQTYNNKDEAHYLIGAMMAINYDHIKSPEKEKILEVLEMARPFEDLYKKFEMIGIQKGMEQGRQEGIQEGLQKGMQAGEKTKALEIARKLMQNGTELSVIMELTGLSEQELEGILPS